MRFYTLCIVCLASILPLSSWSKDDVLEHKIYLPKSKGSVYEMLNLITKEAGLYFIYDSRVVDNGKSVRLAKGEYTVRNAIQRIVGDSGIKIKVVDKHILLYRDVDPPKAATPSVQEVKPAVYIARGTVRDITTKEPIPYVSVGVSGLSIATITNLEGQFMLKLPSDSLSFSFTHLGYVAQTLPVKLFSKNSADIYLESSVIGLPEIIVGVSNPAKIITEMLDRRSQNYSQEPAYLTCFYREGTESGGNFVNLTEAVFKVYKTSFSSATESQARLLKMRKVNAVRRADSVEMKIKAGISSSFDLDVVKNLPTFLAFNREEAYRYAKIGAVLTDSSTVHVIAFEQREGVDEPLWKGELYIDANSSALLKTRFQIHPSYVQRAEELYVVKKSKTYDIKPQEISYEISYMPLDGKYYVSHIRGDLTFKLKKKKQLFSKSITTRCYFEMATCRIDTLDVKPFSRKERISSRSVFSNTLFTYDEAFWGNFNVILPEESINDLISRILVEGETEEAQ